MKILNSSRTLFQQKNCGTTHVDVPRNEKLAGDVLIEVLDKGWKIIKDIEYI